jgi:cell division protein ZapE
MDMRAIRRDVGDATETRPILRGTVSEHYAALVAAGEIERDPAQEAVAAKLSHLQSELSRYRLARKSSSLGWIFASRQAAPLRGLYIYGEVGRGKTMLMDLFYADSPVVRRRRTHFHEFMLDVHERIHDWRMKHKRGEVAGDDPLAPVAAALAEQAWLLCFDEFHVTDIADAMILGRLFKQLFDRGVIVVATSNVAPDELYHDGLNRALFLPFIDLIEVHMEVVRLDARTDFRLEKLGDAPVWYVPADARATLALDDAWRRLTGGYEGAPMEIPLKGRILHVPRAALGTARFSFKQLCGEPHSAADYLKLARQFHTILLDHIPVMGSDQRDEAKRFIVLIDTLYDHAVKLVASADAPPTGLYVGTDGFEAQEFARTASRLIEMGSQSYLARPHGRGVLAARSTEGIVET